MSINISAVESRYERRLHAIIPAERLSPMRTTMTAGRNGEQAEASFHWEVRGDLTTLEIAHLEARGFPVTDWEAEGYEATSPGACRFTIGGPDE